MSGQVARTARGDPLAGGDVAAQTRIALDGLVRALEAVGARPEDVVDVMSFHTDVNDIPAALDVARAYFTDEPPAWTPLGTSGLYDPALLLSINAIAHAGECSKRCATPNGMAWMHQFPMSGACRKGDLIFVSGQSGVDHAGRDSAPGDHVLHTRRAFANAEEALSALGASLDDVIDVASFHLDPRALVPCESELYTIWEGVEPSNAAAWTAIGVAGLFRPGMLSQYRMIADVSSGPRIGHASASIHWKNSVYSGASRKGSGRLIGIAGEVASDGEGNVTTPGDTRRQARYAFNRIREVVELHGGSMADVVSITSFHKDPRAWEIVMEAGRDYFDVDRGPAWTPVGVSGLWNLGYLHEIYATAVL